MNLRGEFPILNRKVHGQPLVYLDSAATSLKPESVINKIKNFYLQENANIHRGAHWLAAEATKNFEQVRIMVKDFLNAAQAEEIIFTSGTTESINLVANILSEQLKPGDEIIISEMEHHSNIVPWYLVAKKMGAVLRHCRVTDAGEIDMEDLKKMLSKKTKILSMTMASNVLGTINPVTEIVKLAKSSGVITVLDAAQAVAYYPVDVTKIDCDFLAFSAHKMFGPFGVGVLYGKKNLLEKLPPWQGGGGMINEVKLDEISFADLPYKFEAGTANISGVIGFGAALKYINDIGFETISKIETKLINKMKSSISEIKQIELYGAPKAHSGIFSFNLKGTHASDVASVLDQLGIAVRAGHHCAQILMKRLKTTSTVRASLGIYNTEEEIDRLIAGLNKAAEILL